MKIKKFDVVELNDKNKAVILEIYKRNKYYAEIVNDKGKTIDKRKIEEWQINKVIYRKK
ncbi:MAG: hypothetical protein KIC56_00270 [Clostridium sp.]|nr:hypothetical protein [Clostridium sp.]MEE0768408.1 hypothetical protein [Clostridia bacterium]